ncbi:hypothetical protein IAU60_003403 [Kwoniella sp. DSM 27419]
MPPSDDRLHLPLHPSSPSLQSHLAALDTLALRLATLTAQTSHPARVHLTSKATLQADIVHTNDVKVYLGDGWYVDMTAAEASDYILRRKKQLLEEHARLAEGRGRPSLVVTSQESESPTSRGIQPSKPTVSLHPLFHSPAVAGPSKVTVPEAVNVATPETRMVSETAPISSETETNAAPPPTVSVSSASPSQPNVTKGSLVELLEDEDGHEESATAGLGDNTTLNEEGLPFHEIRETLDGETIGPLPPATTDPSASDTTVPKVEDDYFTPEAVARRAALRRKLFNEDTDSEDEGGPESSGPKPIKAKGGIIRASSAETSHSDTIEDKAAVSSDEIEAPLPRERRSSSSAPPPSKSILKPAPTRKKSVTFDPSIPALPESPQLKPQGSASASRFGFPLPLAVEEEDYAPKPVPVISTPIPTKRNVEEKGFAGFKRGFLGDPPKVRTDKDDPTSSGSSATLNGTQSPETAAAASGGDSKPIAAEPRATPRKPSLFAQRLSQPEIDASAPTINTTSAAGSGRAPSLPRASEVKSTSTIKPSVVEKPLSKPVTIIERNPPAPRITDTVDEASQGASGSKTAERSTNPVRGVEDGDDDEDGDEEADIDEYSSGEEDEYDLDDALLAREVALEYHRRQAYQPLNRDPSDYADEPDGDEEDDEGGVMLGLPRISDLDPEGHGPLIINPTPDDLRRFVRVGRLENGNLVLAPGEEGSSTDEDADGQGDNEGASRATQAQEGEEEREKRERLERKRNREMVRRRLLGLEPTGPDPAQEKREKNKLRMDQEWQGSVPPSLARDPEVKRAKEPIASTVQEKAPAPLSTQPDTSGMSGDVASKPKKVSRFKAARMGN